jgi:hypothetical protein
MNDIQGGLMKRVWLAAAIAGLTAAAVRAQTTFVTETVSMDDARTVNVEFRPSYRTDQFKNQAGTELKTTLTRIEAIARWVPQAGFEASLALPHVALKLDGGGLSESDSGLGQVVLGGKYALRENAAGLLRLELPTGDADDALGQGLNVGLGAALERDMGNKTGRVNLVYTLTSEYKADISGTGSKTKIDPGDILQLSGAVSGKSKNGLDVTGEAVLAVVGDQKQNGTKLGDSGGNILDFIVGIGKMTQKDWYLKAALALGLGDEEVSSLDTMRGSGDWRLILGASRRWSY